MLRAKRAPATPQGECRTRGASTRQSEGGTIRMEALIELKLINSSFSSSNSSIRALRGYPLVDARLQILRRATRGNGISVSSALPPLNQFTCFITIHISYMYNICVYIYIYVCVYIYIYMCPRRPRRASASSRAVPPALTRARSPAPSSIQRSAETRLAQLTLNELQRSLTYIEQ